MIQKQKNILLIVGLVLIFVMAYAFGFSKTINVSRQLKQLKSQEALYTSAPSQLSALASKETELNKILASNNLLGTSLQNSLLKMLNESSVTSNFKVISFENPHTFTHENTSSKITTYNFSLSGNYEALIRVIYLLEQKYSFGNVVHANFNKQKKYRTGKTNLICNILLQRLH